uniref:Nuclear receptor domain-containing protein n=1 Tax=Ascaris lumbricoides TaxID=6252 RepID=A0A0M3IVD1_ASCLU
GKRSCCVCKGFQTWRSAESGKIRYHCTIDSAVQPVHTLCSKQRSVELLHRIRCPIHIVYRYLTVYNRTI